MTIDVFSGSSEGEETVGPALRIERKKKKKKIVYARAVFRPPNFTQSKTRCLSKKAMHVVC